MAQHTSYSYIGTSGQNLESLWLLEPNLARIVLLTLIRVGGPLGPPPAGIRTPFLNGQRYWAVLWWLLISKPFQSTGELRFEIYYYNFQKFLVKDNWSASILKKNSKNYLFFNFSCKNHTFSVWNWILHEKCFLLMYNMLI